MITTEVQVRFTDIDMLKHVSNIVLQQYYDLGKVDYFNKVLRMPPIWEEEAFVAVSTKTEYYEEVKMDDAIYVTTKISKVGGKSITLSQEIIDRHSGRVKSHSDSVLVAFNLIERVAFELHEEWREIIEKHESN